VKEFSSKFEEHFVLLFKMREIVHLQAGQCGNQIGAKVSDRSQRRKQRFFLDWIQ
jgi:hypothetical protein